MISQYFIGRLPISLRDEFPTQRNLSGYSAGLSDPLARPCNPRSFQSLMLTTRDGIRQVNLTLAAAYTFYRIDRLTLETRVHSSLRVYHPGPCRRGTWLLC